MRILLALLLLTSCSPTYTVEVESNTAWTGFFGLTLSQTGYTHTDHGNAQIDVTINNTASNRGATVHNLTDTGYVHLTLTKHTNSILRPRTIILDTARATAPHGTASVTGR